MRGVLLTTLFIIIFFVFQTTILHFFTILDVRPDLVLIVAAFVGIKSGEEQGATAGFVLGLIQDCLSSGLLGTNAFSKSLIGFIFGNLKDKIFFGNIFSQMVFILLAALIDGAIIFLIFVLTIPNKSQLIIIFNKLLFSLFYTTLIGPLMVMIVIFVKRKNITLPEKRGWGSRDYLGIK